MAQNRSLRPSCGTAGVKQPGRILRRTIGARHRIGVEKAVKIPTTNFDYAFQRPILQRYDRFREIARCKTQSCFAVFENILELRFMQLRIDRNRYEPRVPAPIQGLEKLRTIFHRQTDSVASLKTEGIL